jgi:hypothetical protein
MNFRRLSRCFSANERSTTEDQALPAAIGGFCRLIKLLLSV